MGRVVDLELHGLSLNCRNIRHLRIRHWDSRSSFVRIILQLSILTLLSDSFNADRLVVQLSGALPGG